MAVQVDDLRYGVQGKKKKMVRGGQWSYYPALVQGGPQALADPQIPRGQHKVLSFVL